MPGTALHVRSENGSISVQQADRADVQVIAHVCAVSQERLDAVDILAERTEDGTLSIAAQWPDGHRQGREGCSFEVLIPGATGLDLQTSNGKLSAAGCLGRAELHTSNGAIDLTDHQGPAVAETSNGSVTLTGVWGPVDARSKNGKIHVVGATDAVSARTSNGSVHVEFDPASLGPVDVQTSNGAIELAIGPVFAGKLLLETSNGSIQVEDAVLAQVISRSKNRVRLAFGAFGGSERESKATTSNGAIRVKHVAPEPEQMQQKTRQDAEISESDRQL